MILLANKGNIELFLSDLTHVDKGKLLAQLFAFMEAHPIDLSGEPTPISPDTKRKISFLKQPTTEMAEQIKSQGEEMRRILLESDDKQRNIVIFDAETLKSNEIPNSVPSTA